ncbi:C40 family peptidase [Solibacillus sp. R5-41]|uniref:C40 family peptidase n=1 Tax=Solibacillus sp. R5-41 TaxID=2048654 RepID=UPI0020A50609|nr:C40 family peptidase [Solibacillus sp. R5-41]
MQNKWKTLLSGALFTSVFLVASHVDAATYTVQKGDNLTKIATAHNTTVQQLKQWNKLSNDSIFLEQKLIVATLDKVPSNPVDKVNKPIANKTQYYTVAKGDNLTNIAKKYSATVSDVKKWNSLDSDAIKVGQKLKIQQVSAKDEVNVDEVEDVEEVIDFKETADEAIAKQLGSEQEIIATITSASEQMYNQVLMTANLSLGVPYVFGGNTMEGFDCSGFVNYAYQQAGITMTRKSSLMYFQQDTTKVKVPVPGDLVFFKNTIIPNISHMGIYIGNDEFIHAGSQGVTVANLKTKYWAERFVAFKRLNNVQ